jgi:hypothetical protein
MAETFNPEIGEAAKSRKIAQSRRWPNSTVGYPDWAEFSGKLSLRRPRHYRDPLDQTLDVSP